MLRYQRDQCLSVNRLGCVIVTSASEEDEPKTRMTELHVLFMYDDEETYVEELFNLMISAACESETA